ncbi:MAG: 6-pyruvoyl-tetrahydropterin synthase-related protein [Acidobacteriota bacterium]
MERSPAESADPSTQDPSVDRPPLPSLISKPSRQTKIVHQHLIACAGILILATVIMLPVFVRGFPAGFDAVRHYRWTSQFIDALRDGAFYPRWLPAANEGQGSPVPLYYPPLSFYVGAGFSFVAGNTLLAISLSCWLALVLSGLTMYAFSRSLLSPSLSFGAAALYVMAPYHLLDLYQGATVSEFWSFAWVPLLLDGVHRVSTLRSFRGVGYVALGYALLALTHVPVLFLTSLSLVVYALSLTRKLIALLRIAAGLALGAGVAAIFLIPVLFESSYIKLIFNFDYRDYFLLEHLRAALTSVRFPSDGSPFTYLLDADLIAVGILALFLVSSLLIGINRRSGEKDASPSALWFAIWIVTAFSILMTTRLTAPIWRITPGLYFLFFPYRWLVVVSAGTCLLAALSVWMVMRGRKGRVVQICALAVVVILNLTISTLAVLRASQSPDDLEGGLSRRDTHAYRPVWWNGQLRKEEWQNAARVEHGDADVRATDDTGIERGYTVTAGAESVIALRPLYFPGWIARVDGKQTQIAPSVDGHIQLHIEPGEHTVTLRFEDTWPRTAGKVVSAFSLGIVLLMFFVARRRRPRTWSSTGFWISEGPDVDRTAVILPKKETC